MKKFYTKVIAVLAAVILCGCFVEMNADDSYDAASEYNSENIASDADKQESDTSQATSGNVVASATDSINKLIDIDDIPDYSGEPYVEINGNVPDFVESDYDVKSFESYSPLDSLGRCGVAFANVGKDLMPTEKRGSIGMVKPTGWHTVKYDFVDGGYLYNRCHLIAYQLTAENANRSNLITGTRYMNVEGMLPFEEIVADYVKATENHVLYRVTPIFEGQNLVADGVQMEASSTEDHGESVQFNVFVYNVQPGVSIDYATGESYAA